MHVVREILVQTIRQMFVDIKWRRKWSQSSRSGFYTKVQHCVGRQSWNDQIVMRGRRGRRGDPHRYQSPRPTWQQLPGRLLRLPKPGLGGMVTCEVSRADLSPEEVRSVGLDTADHSEVIEAKEATASEGQVEHDEGVGWLTLVQYSDDIFMFSGLYKIGILLTLEISISTVGILEI